MTFMRSPLGSAVIGGGLLLVLALALYLVSSGAPAAPVARQRVEQPGPATGLGGASRVDPGGNDLEVPPLARARQDVTDGRTGGQGPGPVGEVAAPAGDTVAGTLSGEVIAFSGFRVPSFRIQASPVASGEDAMVRSTRTDELGRFQFNDLSFRDYRVHHAFHAWRDRDALPLTRPPARQLAVYLEQPTLLIHCFGPDGQPVAPERLTVLWGGEEERDPFSSQGPPSALMESLGIGTTLAVLDQPGPWRLLACSVGSEGELQVTETLAVGEEHRVVALTLQPIETRHVTIELVDSSGVGLGDWTAKAWHTDLGFPVEESPEGSHRLELPFGAWKVRLAPTDSGYLSAFDTEIEVAPGDPEARTQRVAAPRIWGRLDGTVDDLSSTYHLTAVHDSGSRYGFTHRPNTDGTKWRSWLLQPGSYTVTVRRVPGTSTPETHLEIQAAVHSGSTTSLDLASSRFRE